MKIINPEAGGAAPRCLTPQEQLWELIGSYQRSIISMVFRRLKNRDQEDLCYGLIAYLRYGIHRPFADSFMQSLYFSLIDLVSGRVTNIIVKL